MSNLHTHVKLTHTRICLVSGISKNTYCIGKDRGPHSSHHEKKHRLQNAANKASKRYHISIFSLPHATKQSTSGYLSPIKLGTSHFHLIPNVAAYTVTIFPSFKRGHVHLHRFLAIRNRATSPYLPNGATSSSPSSKRGLQALLHQRHHRHDNHHHRQE